MNKLDRFDGYVIPSHLEDHSKYRKSETVRYWMVTFTLTSGEVKEFYVKARTHIEALQKAKSYECIANLKLKGEFRLLP